MSDTPSTAEHLDEEFRTHAQRAFDFESPPATFSEFWEQMIEAFETGLDRAVTVEDLCTTEHSPHRATVNGETVHFRCVTDGFLLGALRDEPVTVRTVSPVSETELVVEFDADSVVSSPDGAVLSFGVERSVTAPEGPVTPEKMYGRFCPHNEAFASRAEYDTWASANPEVITVVQPLRPSLELQARLLKDRAFPDISERRDSSSGEYSG